MGKSIAWIITIVVGIAVIFFLYNFVTNKALPLFDEEDNEVLEEGQLSDRAEVTITLEDNRYHRPGCPAITGETERAVKRIADHKNIEPCPYCIDN